MGLAPVLARLLRNLATGGRAQFQFTLMNMAFVCQNRGAVARMTIGPFLNNPQIIVVGIYNHVQH